MLPSEARLQPVVERPTPYHTPHSTQVAGYAAIHGGQADVAEALMREHALAALENERVFLQA